MTNFSFNFLKACFKTTSATGVLFDKVKFPLPYSMFKRAKIKDQVLEAFKKKRGAKQRSMGRCLRERGRGLKLHGKATNREETQF